MKLVELRLQEGNRLPVALVNREDPKVIPGLRIVFGVDDEPAVPGPLMGNLDARTREQQLILPGPTRRFLVQIVNSTSTGAERNAVALRRPNGRIARRSIERETRVRSAGQIPQPDIGGLAR